MDPSFIPVRVTPSKTPFGLDQLSREYKTALSAEAAIAAAPAVGTADEVFPNMFLMPISTPETAESATRIDLLYMGCLAGAEGSPTLPDQKHDSDNAVQSASSSSGPNGPIPSPITIQFYAPTSTLTYFSYLAPGTTPADDPTAPLVIININAGTSNFTGGSVSSLLGYFNPQILGVMQATEIVPGKYWQNVARKTKSYTAFQVNLPPGTAIVSLYNPGINYVAGDTLTISSGGESATIDVITVGSIFGDGGGILSFSVSANSFTASHTALAASGGSGTTAGFNVSIF
jgi:hypothetical protein